MAVFQFHAAENYNSLQEDVRQVLALTMFESRLKTALYPYDTDSTLSGFGFLNVFMCFAD